MNELTIKGRTELLPYRELNERKVFTYADLAEGLQVDQARVRNQFSRNASAWDADETGVYQIGTGAETRWFTARGAMRFCRYVKSGRSDALFNHLLDLWESERSGSLAPRDPITEIDRFAAMMTQLVPAINQRLIAVENATKDLDPAKLAEDAAEIAAQRKRELEEMRGDLHKLVHMIVRRAKSLPEEDSMAKSWSHPSKVWPPVHRHVGVSRLDAYTHADQFEKAIQFARNTLRLLGEEPPVQLRLVS